MTNTHLGSMGFALRLCVRLFTQESVDVREARCVVVRRHMHEVLHNMVSRNQGI